MCGFVNSVRVLYWQVLWHDTPDWQRLVVETAKYISLDIFSVLFSVTRLKGYENYKNSSRNILTKKEHTRHSHTKEESFRNLQSHYKIRSARFQPVKQLMFVIFQRYIWQNQYSDHDSSLTTATPWHMLSNLLSITGLMVGSSLLTRHCLVSIHYSQIKTFDYLS